MDLFAQLQKLEVHDSILKSLTLGFDENYVIMEFDSYEEQTGEYVTHRWTFKDVTQINMANLDVSTGDIEIFSLETAEVHPNAKRITLCFLQGSGKPSATLDFLCKEASTEQRQ